MFISPLQTQIVLCSSSKSLQPCRSGRGSCITLLEKVYTQFANRCRASKNLLQGLMFTSNLSAKVSTARFYKTLLYSKSCDTHPRMWTLNVDLDILFSGPGALNPKSQTPTANILHSALMFNFQNRRFNPLEGRIWMSECHRLVCFWNYLIVWSLNVLGLKRYQQDSDCLPLHIDFQSTNLKLRN